MDCAAAFKITFRLPSLLIVHYTEIVKRLQTALRWYKLKMRCVFPISDAMRKYGTDKPDIRYGFVLEDAETLFPGLVKHGLWNIITLLNKFQENFSTLI